MSIPAHLTARRSPALGPRFVLIKGGPLKTGDAADYLFDGAEFQTFTAPRFDTRNTHGTGCTYASAIAAYLARGCGAPEAELPHLGGRCMASEAAWRAAALNALPAGGEKA